MKKYLLNVGLSKMVYINKQKLLMKLPKTPRDEIKKIPDL